MKKQDQQYLDFLDDFYGQLEALPLDSAFKTPGEAAIISMDVTNAFCRIGILASDRVAEIIEPVVALFKAAWDRGVQKIVLLQDCHTTHAKEFDDFGTHAVCGSLEAEAVDEIKNLPFYDQMNIIEKNSIDPSQHTQFVEWVASHPQVTTFIIVGDCTDLCVYQAAMHLRTSANALDLERRVIIPENCVNTYDVSVESAKGTPVEPHPADLLHKLFLHHMQLNGIEIYKKLE